MDNTKQFKTYKVKQYLNVKFSVLVETKVSATSEEDAEKLAEQHHLENYNIDDAWDRERGNKQVDYEFETYEIQVCDDSDDCRC